MMTRRNGLLWPVAAALTCGLGVAVLSVTLFTVWRLHVPLPYWDEWSSIIDLRLLDQGRYGVADLAGQHNEHRILVPRLVFWADARLFAMSGWLNLAVTMLLQAANAGILLALARRHMLGRAHVFMLAGFVLLLLFTLRQEQNFTNGFQLQFVGVFTAAGLAAVAYARALERFAGGRRSAPLFALAALACGVAAYTMANGILVGFVLAVVAGLRRAKRRVIGATLVLSALLAALYLHGYVPGGASLPPGEIPSHLAAYARYLTAYLGNPVGSDILCTEALGLLGLALAAATAWQVAAGRRHDPDALALLAIMGFVLTSAAMTSYGRIMLGTAQASESRYATPSLIFWSALAIFWFPVTVARSGSAEPKWHAPIPRLAVAALMVLLGGASLWFEVSAWPDLASRSAALRRVSDSLISGLLDAEAVGSYDNNTPAEIAGYVPYLRSHRLAAFADPAFPLAGRVLAASAWADLCPGTVTARQDTSLGADGVRLHGMGPKQVRGATPTRILVTDGDGRVVGFGSASLPGQPRRLWDGYARAKPGQDLRILARDGSGRSCGIGTASVESTPAG